MKKNLAPEQLDSANRQLFASIRAHDAASSLSGLREALANGADPNTKSREHGKKSALEEAASLPYSWAGELALALIDAGATTRLGADGRTALHMASRHGHSDTAMALVARGLDPASATTDGWTAFLCSAANGNFTLCEKLAAHSNVKASAENGSRELRTDAPLLFMAVGEPAMALAAYRNGWGSPSTVANSRWTPLMRAIMGEWDDLVLYLAQHSECDRDHVDFDRKTAMHAAVMVNRADYLKILAQHGHPLSTFQKNGLAPLGLSIAQGNLRCAEELLALGADPAARISKSKRDSGEETDWRGMDALCIAASSESPAAFELARSFIDRCNASSQGLESRNTALHTAAAIDDPELSARWTKLLLSKGWNPNALNFHRQNALMHAMAQKNFSAMEELLHVTDLGVKNKSSLDSLGVAQWLDSSHNSPEPLLRLRAHIEKQELSEQTPSAKKSPLRSRRSL